MSKFFYDLHSHSCLSPCADNDNTPNNLLGMASLSGINVLALTDHNTAKNCPAFFRAAERYGVIPIAGMELTSSEDIHLVCLFESLSGAMEFDKEIEKHRFLIKNRTDIFGEQLILDENDETVATEEYLLSNATDISVEDAPKIAEQYGGVCYPAHIDRDANGIISVLGTFPATPFFSAFEIHDRDKADEYVSRYNLSGKLPIISSDAHYLTDIRDCENYFELDLKADDADAVRRRIIEIIKGKEGGQGR